MASGSKKGVELGGTKTILSVDNIHNFFAEGSIFTELSWAEFYQEEGLEDQIDTFTTKDYTSVREDPEALTSTIITSLNNIMNERRLFYGILDLECDAFMNQNTVIPGLKLDPEVINKLLIAHKNTRDENLFPDITEDDRGIRKIKLKFQGTHEKHLHFYGSKLEDIADRLRLAQGVATGIVCTSRGAANLYIMNDSIVFKQDETAELYIDGENITVIEMGIKRELLFPISWFRIDIGLTSLKSLELWDEIKDNPGLRSVITQYDAYISGLVYKKYKNIASTEKIGKNLEDDFYDMNPEERRKALSDMAGAIRELSKKYKE